MTDIDRRSLVTGTAAVVGAAAIAPAANATQSDCPGAATRAEWQAAMFAIQDANAKLTDYGMSLALWFRDQGNIEAATAVAEAVIHLQDTQPNPGLVTQALFMAAVGIAAPSDIPRGVERIRYADLVAFSDKVRERIT